MTRTPSKTADLTRLVAVVVVGALLAGAGLWFFTSRGGGAVDGRVYYQGDDTYSVQLGPGGWFVHSDDEGGYLVEHAQEGGAWQLEGSGRPEALTSDGRSVSALGGDVTISGDGTRVQALAADLLVAHGDKTLRAGESAEVIGLSEEHVAVVSCLSPDGAARLDEEGTDGQLVVSGVALDDGAVTWSHDPGVACDADLAALYPTALPEQRYVLLTPRTDRTEALDLDTGRIARNWQDSPRGRVVVREDIAVHRSGDEVTATSLRSGREVARVSCPGARLDTPGDSGGRLSADATPLVRCGDSVRLLDESGFVTVEAPPVGESQEVPDGRSVVHDRYLLRRDGDRVTITDALSGTGVGSVEVPDGMRIATNEPRGRLVVFYRTREAVFGDKLSSSQRVVDARTATTVAAGDGMAPGAQASPDGYAVLSKRTERRRSRAARQYVWVVGVR